MFYEYYLKLRRLAAEYLVSHVSSTKVTVGKVLEIVLLKRLPKLICHQLHEGGVN
jgi:hypothetical protein